MKNFYHPWNLLVGQKFCLVKKKKGYLDFLNVLDVKKKMVLTESFFVEPKWFFCCIAITHPPPLGTFIFKSAVNVVVPRCSRSGFPVSSVVVW